MLAQVARQPSGRLTLRYWLKEPGAGFARSHHPQSQSPGSVRPRKSRRGLGRRSLRCATLKYREYSSGRAPCERRRSLADIHEESWAALSAKLRLDCRLEPLESRALSELESLLLARVVHIVGLEREQGTDSIPRIAVYDERLRAELIHGRAQL